MLWVSPNICCYSNKMFESVDSVEFVYIVQYTLTVIGSIIKKWDCSEPIQLKRSIIVSCSQVLQLVTPALSPPLELYSMVLPNQLSNLAGR